MAALESLKRGGPRKPHSEKISVRNLDFFYGESQALKKVGLPFTQLALRRSLGVGLRQVDLVVLDRVYELYCGQCATGEVLLDGKNILSPKQSATLSSRDGFSEANSVSHVDHEKIAFGVRFYQRLSVPNSTGGVEQAFRGAGLWEEIKGRLFCCALLFGDQAAA